MSYTHTNIIIRSKDQLNKMNKALTDALYETTKFSGTKIPLIYQYLHNPNSKVYVDETNSIGFITNIRKDKMGNIAGNIIINNPLSSLSTHFTGIIDNMVVVPNSNGSGHKILAFIIYDKGAKQTIDNKSQVYSKVGQIPDMMGISNEKMKEISNEILKEYENSLDIKQTSKIEKEDIE